MTCFSRKFWTRLNIFPSSVGYKMHQKIFTDTRKNSKTARNRGGVTMNICPHSEQRWTDDSAHNLFCSSQSNLMKTHYICLTILSKVWIKKEVCTLFLFWWFQQVEKMQIWESLMYIMINNRFNIIELCNLHYLKSWLSVFKI